MDGIYFTLRKKCFFKEYHGYATLLDTKSSDHYKNGRCTGAKNLKNVRVNKKKNFRKESVNKCSIDREEKVSFDFFIKPPFYPNVLTILSVWPVQFIFLKSLIE